MAFKEMRDGGYEEDGLFDEMKSFFQPLTVTDAELIIDEEDRQELIRMNEEEKRRLAPIVKKLADEHTAKENERKALEKRKADVQRQRNENTTKYTQAMNDPDLSDARREEAAARWPEKEKELYERLIVLSDLLGEKEKELQTTGGKKIRWRVKGRTR